MKKIIISILCILYFSLSAPANAFIGGFTTPHDCDDAVGWFYTNNMCNWSAQGATDGVNYIAHDTTAYSATVTNLNGVRMGFVPYAADWQLRTYICPTATAIKCSVAKSSTYLSSSTIFINSGQDMYEQQGNFMTSGNIPAGSSICYIFIDPKYPDKLWKSGSAGVVKRFCSEGSDLPSEAATCYINSNQDLSVSLGTLERSEIATRPMKNSAGNKKISVDVLCTADATVDVLTQFQYTPITIEGVDVVSSSSEGLGVAMFYNGQLMSPIDTRSENFATGYSSVELEFQAVRDPSMDLKDIPSGNFTAHVVMIMTQQ